MFVMCFTYIFISFIQVFIDCIYVFYVFYIRFYMFYISLYRCYVGFYMFHNGLYICFIQVCLCVRLCVCVCLSVSLASLFQCVVRCTLCGVRGTFASWRCHWMCLRPGGLPCEHHGLAQRVQRPRQTDRKRSELFKTCSAIICDILCWF